LPAEGLARGVTDRGRAERGDSSSRHKVVVETKVRFLGVEPDLVLLPRAAEDPCRLVVIWMDRHVRAVIVPRRDRLENDEVLATAAGTACRRELDGHRSKVAVKRLGSIAQARDPSTEPRRRRVVRPASSAAVSAMVTAAAKHASWLGRHLFRAVIWTVLSDRIPHPRPARSGPSELRIADTAGRAVSGSVCAERRRPTAEIRSPRGHVLLADVSPGARNGHY